MATAYYSNTAVPTTLSGSISSGATSISVAATTGFPSSFPYTLALDYGAGTEELVSVTAAAGLTLTVTRGFSGTSAQSHSLGAAVRHVYHAGDATDFRTHQDATADVHGVTGALVGATQTQTLTNKTLTAPTITNPTVTGGGSLAGTFTGTPTFSGAVVFTGAPTFSTLAPIYERSAATDNAQRIRVAGDSNSRLTINADGKMTWGSGSATGDTVLYREGASALATDDIFRIYRGATTDSAFAVRVTGDTNSRFQAVASGELNWGAGGASAVDTNLYRSAANTLKTDDSLVVAGSLTVNGVGGTQVTYKASDTTRTSTSTLADPDLSFNAVNGEVYIVEALLLIKGDSASDINVSWGGGTSQGGMWAPINYPTGTSGNSGSVELVASTWATARSFGIHATSTSVYGIHIKGCLIGASTELITVAWGAFVGGGTGTTLAAGSYLKATRIA